jgi:hypothetical protein
MKNRKIVAKNRSGGIILGYRQEIASKIKQFFAIPVFYRIRATPFARNM